MENKTIGNLECPSCLSKFDIITVLNNFINVWPEDKLFSFSCPICFKHSFSHIENNKIEIGDATMDSFTSYSEIYEPELFIEIKDDRIIVDYNHDFYNLLRKAY
jgi:hypothetical protein